MGADRGAKVVDFLWLLLPLGVLAGFRKGAEPAGLAVGFALYFVGPLLGGLIMLEKGRSSARCCWWPPSCPSSATSRSSASRAAAGSTRPRCPACPAVPGVPRKHGHRRRIASVHLNPDGRLPRNASRRRPVAVAHRGTLPGARSPVG